MAAPASSASAMAKPASDSTTPHAAVSANTTCCHVGRVLIRPLLTKPIAAAQLRAAVALMPPTSGGTTLAARSTMPGNASNGNTSQMDDVSITAKPDLIKIGAAMPTMSHGWRLKAGQTL